MVMPKKLNKRLFVAAVCLFTATGLAFSQTTLPTGVPEKEGISSIGINNFLDAAAKSPNEFHSFMFLRHGKVIAQGWWNPYKPQLRHSLYSVSKSFTSTAVGFAVSEKKLSLSDKVISFFKADLPDTIPPYLAQLTVKDLITMSVGQEPDPTFSVVPATDNWTKAFLALPIVHKPGSKFLYNTLATYMLSAIVQKVTGQKEFDYLKPRLFEPLGIHGEDWEVSKQGINTGGWGLRLKTEDMAKLGQLYLQKGNWKGRQLLPKAWIEEATTFKIDQAPGVAQSKRDSSDWMQGYCYQFWRCRHNAFRADGAYGQYIIVMPDEDAVIAITAETANMQDEINLVWQYLLPSMHPKALPANFAADAKLNRLLAKLAIPALKNKSGKAASFNKMFILQKNALLISNISLNITNGNCIMTLKQNEKSYAFNLGSGKWIPGTTALQGPALTAAAREDFSILQPYKVDGSYGWIDKNTLKLKIRYIESPHTETITCHFDKQQLTADVDYSFNAGKNTIELTGKASN